MSWSGTARIPSGTNQEIGCQQIQDITVELRLDHCGFAEDPSYINQLEVAKGAAKTLYLTLTDREGADIAASVLGASRVHDAHDDRPFISVGAGHVVLAGSDAERTPNGDWSGRIRILSNTETEQAVQQIRAIAISALTDQCESPIYAKQIEAAKSVAETLFRLLADHDCMDVRISISGCIKHDGEVWERVSVAVSHIFPSMSD